MNTAKILDRVVVVLAAGLVITTCSIIIQEACWRDYQTQNLNAINLAYDSNKPVVITKSSDGRYEVITLPSEDVNPHNVPGFVNCAYPSQWERDIAAKKFGSN